MVVFRLPKMEAVSAKWQYGVISLFVSSSLDSFAKRTSQKGLVVVCVLGQPAETTKNNTAIEFYYNTVKLDPDTFEIWPNPKCLKLLSRFPTSGRESETPTGHAYLAIKVINDMDEVIRVSHVITV
jgi:hypothetical protein